jgi:hypothetical protein
LSLTPFDVDNETRIIMDWTEHKWLLWLDNLGANLESIRKGKNINDIPVRKGAAVIVGAGPSLYKYRHLDLLKKYRTRIPTIFATDRMLKPLIQVEVTPHLVSTVDGDPSVSQFYRLNTEERLRAKTDVVLSAVTTHPQTLKAIRENLSGDIYWYTHMFDNPTDPRCPKCNRFSITTAAYYLDGQKGMIRSPGNIGATIANIALSIGCNPIILVGLDFSYPANLPIEKTMYYDGYLKRAGLDREKVKQSYRVETNPDFQREYLIDGVWNVYKHLMLELAMYASKVNKVQFINATGNGALHGEGIIGMELEDALEKYCDN